MRVRARARVIGRRPDFGGRESRAGALGAGEFDGVARAVVEGQDEAALVGVEGDDGADEPDPSDWVVEVEVEVLACAVEER